MSVFSNTLKTFALAAMFVACKDPGAGTGPVTPGGEGTDPGTKPQTQITVVPVGVNKNANSMDFDAATGIFTVKQTVEEGKSTILFKIVDDLTGPKLDTTGITSNGSVLDPSKINLDATTKSQNYSFVKYHNNAANLPLNISAPGYYIGDTQADKNKKVEKATYSGVSSVAVVNGTKNARENVEDMLELVKAVKRGEKKLQLIGQTANGYDNTFTYGNQNKPGTAFVIGNFSIKP